MLSLKNAFRARLPSKLHRQLIHQHHLQSHLQWGNDPRRSYSCKAQWNSMGNSSTNTTCNPIYIAGTILQLQITMEFHRQLIHQHHLQSHLHCGNDPTVANHNGILSTANARKTLEAPFTMRNRSEHDPRPFRPHTRPSRTRRTAEVDHRRSGTDFVWKNIGFRASALSKTHFVRDFLQNSIGNSSTSTTCNPIYSEGTILELRITMEFHRQLIHQHHLQSHLHCGNDPTVANHNGILSTANARNTAETPFTVRNRSEHDPRPFRPHTRPSCTRRTAEVDHRRSGTDFVWKNIGFRASAISQKRISCETSSKTPSATHPPAPLAIPFTVKENGLC